MKVNFIETFCFLHALLVFVCCQIGIVRASILDSTPIIDRESCCREAPCRWLDIEIDTNPTMCFCGLQEIRVAGLSMNARKDHVIESPPLSRWAFAAEGLRHQDRYEKFIVGGWWIVEISMLSLC